MKRMDHQKGTRCTPVFCYMGTVSFLSLIQQLSLKSLRFLHRKALVVIVTSSWKETFRLLNSAVTGSYWMNNTRTYFSNLFFPNRCPILEYGRIKYIYLCLFSKCVKMYCRIYAILVFFQILLNYRNSIRGYEPCDLCGIYYQITNL